MTAPPFHTYREYRGFAQSSECTRADHTRSPGFSGGAYVSAREVRNRVVEGVFSITS